MKRDIATDGVGSILHIEPQTYKVVCLRMLESRWYSATSILETL